MVTTQYISEVKVCDECSAGTVHHVPACSLAGDGGSVSKCAAEPKGPSGFSALQRPAGLGVTQFTGRITLALGPLRIPQADQLNTACPHWYRV